MNTFTADKAKELSSMSRNNHSAIVNYIMYHAFLGHDFVMLEKDNLYYKDAIEEKDELRKDGYNVLEFLEGIKIDWRQK